MKTSPILLILAVSTSLLPASLITYQFDGAVSVGMPHPTQPGTNVHPANTPFVGMFSYDSTAAQSASTPNSATYPLIDLHLTFNPNTTPETVVLPGGTIDVVDDPFFGDSLFINGLGSPPVTVNTGGFNLDFHGIGLSYQESTGLIFSSTDLPGTNLTEADFPPSGSYVFAYSEVGSTATFQADGNLDNLRSAAVPEPSSPFVLLGLLVINATARRRK